MEFPPSSPSRSRCEVTLFIYNYRIIYQFLWLLSLRAMSTWSNLRHRRLRIHNLYLYRVRFRNRRLISNKHCCIWKQFQYDACWIAHVGTIFQGLHQQTNLRTFQNQIRFRGILWKFYQGRLFFTFFASKHRVVWESQAFRIVFLCENCLLPFHH